MTKPNFANNLELSDTVKVGNRLAQQIIANGPRPNYSATLRHVLSTQGPWVAQDIARALLGIDEMEAREIVARLVATRADDIWTPHERGE